MYQKIMVYLFLSHIASAIYILQVNMLKEQNVRKRKNATKNKKLVNVA